MNLSKFLFIFTITILPFGFAINPASGIDLNIIRIIIPVLFVVWLGESLFRRKLFIDTRPRFLFFILFLVIVFLSAFWAPEQQRAWRKILFIFSIIPIYFVAFDLFKKKSLLKEVFLKTFIVTSLLQAALGVFQFILQFIIGIDPSLKVWRSISMFFLGENFAKSVHQYSSWLVNLSGKTVLRAFGTFPDPHLFSLFIALSLPTSLYFFQKTKKNLYLIIIFIQLIAIALSFSRSSYLAVIIFLILFGTIELNKKLKQKKNIWIYLTGIFLIIIIIFTSNPVSKRFYSSFNLQEGSNQGRIEMWGKSFEIIKENPWGGVGIGNLSYKISPSSNLREPIYAHNLFLDFGSESGIIALTLLVLIFLSVFLNLFSKKEKDAFYLNNTIVYFFLIFFVFSLFETPFYSIRIFPIFLILLSISYEKK